MSVFSIVLSLIVLGLVFGSLGSVIFFRLGDLPNRSTLKGFFFGRSECRFCHHTLQVQDLIPLWSFCVQKGKCRYCHRKLSWRYPVLELATVFIFLLSYAILGRSSPVLMGVVALGGRLLLLILLYDIQHYELHLTATLLLLSLSVVGQWLLGYHLFWALKYGLIFFLLFLIIYFLAKGYVSRRYQKHAEGFGFGDVLFAGVVGTMFSVMMPVSSWEQMYLVCMYLVLSCVFALLHYGINLTASPKAVDIEVAQQGGKIVPFLPAMIVAFVVMMVRGTDILHAFVSRTDHLLILLYY